MQKRKINYRFHNPNSAAATADYILKILIDANSEKVEKAIQAAANQMLDEADDVKAKLYKYIYKKQRRKFKELTNEMLRSANNPKKIQELQKYTLGNWSAVIRAYHNKLLSGCSAEGHVSHLLSSRLSSRPMGWSQTGDR